MTHTWAVMWTMDAHVPRPVSPIPALASEHAFFLDFLLVLSSSQLFTVPIYMQFTHEFTRTTGEPELESLGIGIGLKPRDTPGARYIHLKF